MTTEVALSKPSEGGLTAETREAILQKNDLGKMTYPQREAYYINLCNQLGLTWVTRPFEWLNLSGKLVLYAKKDCTDQLRKIHKVSLSVGEPKVDHERQVVTVRATAKLPDGRSDEDYGSSSVQKAEGIPRKADQDHPSDWKEYLPLKGADYENAVLRAVTKAKRRVTLSICGLGFLDEAELDTVASKPVDTTPVKAERAEFIRLYFRDNPEVDLGKFLGKYGKTNVEELTAEQAEDMVLLARTAIDLNS